MASNFWPLGEEIWPKKKALQRFSKKWGWTKRWGVAQSGHCMVFFTFFLYEGFPNVTFSYVPLNTLLYLGMFLFPCNHNSSSSSVVGLFAESENVQQRSNSSFSARLFYQTCHPLIQLKLGSFHSFPQTQMHFTLKFFVSSLWKLLLSWDCNEGIINPTPIRSEGQQ